ncbi:Manganese transporter smf1 [Cryptotrichosporon argae]
MRRLKRARDLFVRHLRFVGPGLVSAVAYVDPGNWATDLSAGAEYGYKLLFVVLVAGLAAVVLQLLAVRLGAVTSSSLPAQTRLFFERLQYRHPRYARPLKLCLWGLYALAEIAIVGTDLAELLGSAIALNLLFPKLPLFAGVLITASDVLVILAFFRSESGRQGMLLFEIAIVSLVLAVFISFMILLHLIQPEWREVFLGLVPSKTLVKPGALYVGVGIIGATVMPHALFLGSSLASVDRLNMLPTPPSAPVERRNARLPSLFASLRRRRAPADCEDPRRQHAELDDMIELGPVTSARPASSALSRVDTSKGTDADAVVQDKEDDYAAAMGRYEAEVRAFDRIAWVDIHVYHSTIDTVYSLLGFALTINASILTVAGAAYYYGTTGADASDADLAGAFALIKTYVGHGAGIIFALALLFAGQSASITATLAGQIVSEGFVNWRTPPLLRRLVTRLLGVVPAAVVAVAVGQKGLNTMLVASQVLLSVVLPTVIAPLVYLASRDEVMTVLGPEVETRHEAGARGASEGRPPSAPGAGPVADGEPNVETASHAQPRQTDDAPLAPTHASPALPAPPAQTPPRLRKSYASPKWVTALGYALFGIVVLANGYVIVELALGRS